MSGLEEATVAQLGAWMAAGRETAASITEWYLARIAALDRRGPGLHAVIETNPDALSIAAALDDERRAGRVRGPLHGIPVLVKDNIDTGDRMATTAGSYALAGLPAAADAPLVARLRASGAIVLGKANLTEWANFRSISASSGWSARGGQCRNPYVLDRSPIGSSSGSAVGVAANLAALAVGTETDGSIVYPAAASAVVGIKPTVGLVSRTGVIPIAESQDTAGPMARTVTDAAILLAVIAGPDPEDPVTQAVPADALGEWGRAGAAPERRGLTGIRLGVARDPSFADAYATAVFDVAVEALRALGATLVDPVALPHLDEYKAPELTVLLTEFKSGLERYLARRGDTVTLRTLADVIAFNEQDRARELAYFGQDLFLMAQETRGLEDAVYRAARETCLRLARTAGLDAVLAEHRLDALVTPTIGLPGTIDTLRGDHHLDGSSAPAAISGYPSVTVPAGQAFGLPVGMSFTGRPWSEPALIRIAFEFEQATWHRRPPRFLASHGG
ncbi:MAG: amidase [Chloroflexi bacterium]|nr:amidase [Chloroflexota bacterium]